MHYDSNLSLHDSLLKMKMLRKVFKWCKLYKLRMNPPKCVFGVFVGKLLGFIVHSRGIDADPTKASAIATLKPQYTIKESKSFLGKVAYIRRFRLGLALITSAFAKLLRKGRGFVWGSEQQKAFHKL